MIIDLYESVKGYPEYFKQLKCKDLLFTLYDCPQEAIKQDLFSASFYITYVISGKRIFHLPGETHIMTKGKCVFAKKGGWIAEKEPAAGWCVLVFFISEEYLKGFVNEFRQHFPARDQVISVPHQMIDLDVNDTTLGFFYSMLPYFTQNPPPPEPVIELKFRELLFNLLMNPANASLSTELCQIADCRKVRIQEIMEANYVFNLSLADFAKLTSRSTASFKREFASIYQTSPGKWLLQKRLDHASMMLKDSLKPVNEIAFESGFENATHFTRVFKEKFGSPPLKFRQKG